ncbi:MAG: hypothetical protein KIT14_22140 [bacterium]|nr:hypothetical protein [bacterium]
MRRRALLGLLMALVAGLARADEAPAPVAVRAWYAPEKLTVGDRFRYFIEVSAAPGVEVVLAQPTEKLGDFDILDFGNEAPVTRDGRAILVRWYEVVGWSPGHHLVRSPPVQYRTQSGSPLESATGDDLGIEVTSVLGEADATGDIRDIAPPEDFPRDWRPVLLLGGAGLAVLAAIAALVWWRRRRVRGARTAAPEPAHVVALRALEALRARQLPQAGAWKAFYSALSDVVRAYLEHRFGVRAPEMTTEEFLQAATRGGRLERAHRQLLADFLVECDLVKFARHVPTLEQCDRAFAAARRFVDETTAVTALTPERGRAAG